MNRFLQFLWEYRLSVTWSVLVAAGAAVVQVVKA